MILLPDDLFYNTTAAGVIVVLPDAPHRAARRAYPGDPIRSHEMGQKAYPFGSGSP